MSRSPLHSVSVAGVTFDDAGRVLMIKRRDDGQWQAPGGVLELGETFEEGVAREVLEETGVEVDVERLTGVYKNMSIGVVALVFKCRPVGGRASASFEASEACWVDVEIAVSKMSPAFAVRVTDAHRDLPTTRTHDGFNLL